MTQSQQNHEGNESLQLINAVRNGRQEELIQILSDGSDPNVRDEQGWTPLNWAAGRGDAEAVKTLLDHGADPTATGRDNRTPLMIAKAAGRSDVVRLLTEAEQEKGAWQDPRESRPYCRAYYLRDLEPFAGWPSQTGAGGDGEASRDEVVYLHQDFTVTASMWHGEDVLFDQVSTEWRAFCVETLDFAIPEDLL